MHGQQSVEELLWLEWEWVEFLFNKARPIETTNETQHMHRKNRFSEENLLLPT